MFGSKALTQIVAALLLSIAAGVLIFKWMNARTAEQVAVAPETVEILVAKESLVKGIPITEAQVKAAPYLKESLPSQYFTDVKILVGRMPAVDVAPGEPLSEARLVSLDKSVGGVSSLITPGMRAVAVQGNKVMGLAGFVRPGNRVDVLVTIERNGHDVNSEPKAKLVLENIRILATGTEFQSTDSEGPAPVDTYTLELTPSQSEILALAATKGTLHFALRNPADEDSVLTGGVGITGTLAQLKPAPKKKKKVASVEVVRGGAKESQRF